MPFVFSVDCSEAFKTLKEKLILAPITVALEWDIPFKLMCDQMTMSLELFWGNKEARTCTLSIIQVKH